MESSDNLNEQARRAVQAYVGSRIHRLVDWTDPTRGGSAVKIRIANRHFFATASHVIPDSHEIRVLLRGEENQFIRSFVNRARDPATDVGLLEITSEDAALLDGNFVLESDIQPRFHHRTSQIVVAGYPGQLIHSADREVLTGFVAKVHDHRQLTFLTHSLLRSEWPTGLKRKPTSRKDIFASFDPELQLHMIKLNDPNKPPTEIAVDELKLPGISGGGIWLHLPTSSDSEVWTPNLRLLALDVSVEPKERWLRGTSISNWLQLLQQHYPDLKRNIEAILSPRKKTARRAK